MQEYTITGIIDVNLYNSLLSPEIVFEDETDNDALWERFDLDAYVSEICKCAFNELKKLLKKLPAELCCRCVEGSAEIVWLCSKNSVNATSVTKSEISRFRSRRPLPPDPYCSAPTQPPPLAAAWPWQVIGKNAKLNRRRDTFVSEISEFRHRRRD